MDPDESVQNAIRLVFERFRIDGSAYGVTRYFARMGLFLPARDLSGRQLVWGLPRQTLVLSILHNPIYAGTYVFGRKEERLGLVNGKVKRRKVRKLPQDQWKSVIHDRHPAFISWEEFMANQKKLDDNRTQRFDGARHGAAREGSALLQGLVLCGCCGRRMGTRYQGVNRRVQYQCRPNYLENVVCFELAGEPVDRAVEKLFLEAVSSSEIELALSIARETEKQASEIDRQWQLRIERLQYEARLAERRYKAIDPDNRVVARTLEREWEGKLREIEQANAERDTVSRREKLELTTADREQIVGLAKDLPQVWAAETTTHAERKNLLRMLVREVTVSPLSRPHVMTRIQVWWHTGAVSDIIVTHKTRYTAQATPVETVALIREKFTQSWEDDRIAAELNRRKVPRAVQGDWDVPAVRRVRYAYGLYRTSSKARRTPLRRADGLYSVHGVAERIGVTPNNVKIWVQGGFLTPVAGGGTGHALWFRLDEETIQSLMKAKARRFH